MVRTSAQPTVLLAGWLFADLAVGLVIILLATATDAPVRAPEATASPTPSPTASPSPTPTPAVQLGMEQEPVVFRVQSDASALLRRDAGEVERVADEIREYLEPYEQDGRRAGVVLTFGGSPDAGQGVDLAEVANDILRDTVPDFVGRAAIEDYWAATGRDGVTLGTIEFKIYTFVEG